MSDTDDRLCWYPRYPADWRTSETVIRLTMAGRGIYGELCDMQWERRGDPLPEDPEVLRRYIGASEEDWNDSWAILERSFPIVPGGRSNPRMAREWERAVSHWKRRSHAGRVGGLASARARKAKRDTVLERPLNDRSQAKATIVNDSNHITSHHITSQEDDLPCRGDVETAVSTPAPPRVDWSEQQARWNTIATANGLPILRKWNEGRKRALKARLREEPEFWPELNRAIEERGEWARDHGFPSFDQAVRASTYAKLVEGNYADRNGGPVICEEARAAMEALERGRG